MDDIPRIPSGIPGLDRNIEGGFPNPMILLLEGEPGTGKSTFALQMLMNECEGHNRIYFSGISEPFENMKRNMGRHRFFRGDLIDEDVVHFMDIGHALVKMHSKLGVERVLSTGGGKLNGALIRAGLVDEVNVELLPAVVGGLRTASLFDSPDLAKDEWPIRLELISAQVQPGGRVWVRYRVCGEEEEA